MSEFKTIKVKHFIGQAPGDMAAEWMTGEDWDKWHEYVERCKADGTYGQEVESTLIYKPHHLFDDNTGFILDLNSIERHTLKPLMTAMVINLCDE